MKTEAVNPDPVAALMATNFIKPSDRLEELRSRFSDLKWCLGLKDDDHNDCEPFKVLDKALNMLRPLGCSINDPMPGKENLPVGQYLHSKMWKCACVFGEKPEGFDKDIDTPEALAEYMVERIKILDVPATGVMRVQPDVPPMRWDRCKARYCVKDATGTWQHEGKEDARDRLIEAGLDPRARKGELSECDQELLNVRNHSAVDMMLPLAGYQAGMYAIRGSTILVPSGFKLIEPKNYEDGKCNHVFGLVRGLLELSTGTEEEKLAPFWHFCLHLRNSYEALKSGQRSGAPVPFIVGPQDCGKSLLLEVVVVPVLGGRYANAYNYVSGQSNFNDDLIKNEIWLIDDGVPLADFASRKRMNGLIKQSVAANHVPCHPKGKGQETLPLYRRLWVALNDEDLETLPVLSRSLGDKYMLLKAKSFAMPKGCLPLPAPKDRPAFAAKILEELPCFLGWLMEQELSDFAARRFGVAAYKNAELVADHADSSGLDAKYEVLCDILFTGMERKTDAVEKKTADIWLELTSSSIHHQRAVNEFRNAISLGITLGDLSRSEQHAGLVTKRTRDGYSVWTICRPATSEGSGCASNRASRKLSPHGDIDEQ